MIHTKSNILKNGNEEMLLKPKYDVVFQSLFSDKNKEETSYFISAILGRKVHVIHVDTEVSQIREYPKEKIGRMDLIAHTDEKELIHIEIQLIDYLNTTSRLLYSLCQNVSKQLVRGEDYSNITKTITIGLLDYNMKELTDLNKMHTIWNLREKNNEKKLTDLAGIHIIEMSRAKYEYEKNHNNILAEWILFILDPNMQEVKSIMDENKEIKRTAEKLENLNDDESIRKRAEILAGWELEEKWNRASLMNYVKKTIEEGIEEGIVKKEAKVREEGMKKGIEEGKKEGKKEGKEEGKKEGKAEARVEIAKKMLEKSIDIDTISIITGLDKMEIESFKE